MPFRPHLFDEILAALNGLAPANLAATSAGNDLYEGYAWALVIEAARREGADVSFRTNTGSAPTTYFFRKSPSSIFSTLHPYCHAEIAFQNCPTLEAHVGVYVAGRSQVEHECDVAVLHKSEADLCRQRAVHPRSSKLIVAVECKFYINANVGINLGRSFLGLLSDIYSGERFFVSTKDSSSVKKLFAKHNKEYELGLSPLVPDIEVRLRGGFEKAFRDFKAGYG
jgi:hypothetical protein